MKTTFKCNNEWMIFFTNKKKEIVKLNYLSIKYYETV